MEWLTSFIPDFLLKFIGEHFGHSVIHKVVAGGEKHDAAHPRILLYDRNGNPTGVNRVKLPRLTHGYHPDAQPLLEGDMPLRRFFGHNAAKEEAKTAVADIAGTVTVVPDTKANTRITPKMDVAPEVHTPEIRRTT